MIPDDGTGGWLFLLEFQRASSPVRADAYGEAERELFDASPAGLTREVICSRCPKTDGAIRSASGFLLPRGWRQVSRNGAHWLSQCEHTRAREGDRLCPEHMVQAVMWIGHMLIGIRVNELMDAEKQGGA